MLPDYNSVLNHSSFNSQKNNENICMKNAFKPHVHVAAAVALLVFLNFYIKQGPSFLPNTINFCFSKDMKN